MQTSGSFINTHVESHKAKLLVIKGSVEVLKCSHEKRVAFMKMSKDLFRRELWALYKFFRLWDIQFMDKRTLETRFGCQIWNLVKYNLIYIFWCFNKTA